MTESRTRNSVLNIVASFGGTLMYDIGYFFLRAVFIRTLAEEYLGVEGLFSSILSMLSLMELGIGPAMSVSLYRPVAEQNTEKIKGLMALYRKAYTVVGLAILGFGLLLTPFLSYIIKEPPENIPNLKFIFILYLFNTAASYFFIYKQSIFIAHQKHYLVSLWHNSARIVMLLVQGVILVTTHSFIAYLCVQILAQYCSNLFISRQADLKYPYLKEKEVSPVDAETLSEVKRNAVSATILNIGSKLVNSTDQIIITGFIGLVTGGMYSNYVMVTAAITSIESKIFTAFTAGVGNLYVTAPREQFKTVFYRILFLGLWFSTFLSASLYCVLQDFVALWVGPGMLLSEEFVFCMIISFFIYSMRFPVQIFNSATGNYHHMKYRALAEGLINLIVSLLLVREIGISGVVVGTIVSCIVVPFWIEPYIFYKHILKTSMAPYWGFLAKNTLLFAAVCGVTGFLCGLIPGTGIGAFFWKFLVCCAVPNGILLLVYCKNEHLRFFLRLGLQFCKRLAGKR